MRCELLIVCVRQLESFWHVHEVVFGTPAELVANGPPHMF